jgi:glycerophosphoryl diester phosphodiesterase/HEAT repeat protein
MRLRMANRRGNRVARVALVLLTALSIAVSVTASMTGEMFAATNAGELKRVELLCHRTANEDVPENTLASLEQAALLGCDVVEIDLRQTVDGVIVLNHDGFLERLTDGVGETEKTFYDDLKLRDAGAWMGARFASLPMATFEDALRLAKHNHIRLILDIKTKGIGKDVLALVDEAGMRDQVQFSGEWSDVRAMAIHVNDGSAAKWVQPGITAEEISVIHQSGQRVIANFSANNHAMDLAAMRAAAVAGVDGINVDYPRLGADAVGRPVEQRLATLVATAEAGEIAERRRAILTLSKYRGFPLESQFSRWLYSNDDTVSRAAALALIGFRPAVSASAFVAALRSENADVRGNAAWALGMIHASADDLVPMLTEKDPGVLQQVLLALGRMDGLVPAESLLPLLSAADGRVRAADAIALARHQPRVASDAVPKALQMEVRSARVLYEDYVRRGKPQLTPEEITTITGSYRCQMKMLEAIGMLNGPEVTRALEGEAFRAGDDFSQMNGVVAGFQLWDRVAGDEGDVHAVMDALASTATAVADRAEWILIHAGPTVLPQVRLAMARGNAAVRERAIRILALQGDFEAIDSIRSFSRSDPDNATDLNWAVDKIESIRQVTGNSGSPSTTVSHP